VSKLNLLLLILLSLGHMVTDLSQGGLPVINLYLAEALKLNYSQVGIITLAFTFSSAIIQPFFGYFSDRLKFTWLLPLGCLVSSLGLALTGIVPVYWLLLVVVLFSGLGVAGYHPEGSKTAFFASGIDNRFLSMSIFSVGGNLGVGLGPLIAYFLLGRFGLKGTAGFLAPGLVMAFAFLFVYAQINKLRPAIPAAVVKTQKKKAEIISKPLILVILYITARSWIHTGLITFYPFYCVHFLGMDKTYASTSLTFYLLAGVFGTMIGGPIADRWGDKTILLGSMAISALFIIPFIFSQNHVLSLVFAALTGVVLISTFSTTVVYGQRLMPDNVGMASGLILGFAIGAGSIGVSILGYLSDLWGLLVVMRFITFLPLASLILAFFLPDLSRQAVEVKGESGRKV